MIGLVESVLAKQDPSNPHTLMTRVVVSLCICIACLVLYGFFGMIGSIIVYLIGVELMGLPAIWMYTPFILGLLIGSWYSVRNVYNYWTCFGAAE